MHFTLKNVGNLTHGCHSTGNLCLWGDPHLLVKSMSLNQSHLKSTTVYSLTSLNRGKCFG